MSLLVATGCVAGLALYTGFIDVPAPHMMLFTGGALAVVCGIIVLSAADAQREEETEEAAAGNQHVLPSSLSHSEVEAPVSESQSPVQTQASGGESGLTPEAEVVGRRRCSNETSKPVRTETRSPDSLKQMNQMFSKSAALFKRLVENRQATTGCSAYCRLEDPRRQSLCSQDSDISQEDTREKNAEKRHGHQDFSWLAEEDEEDFDDLDVVVIEDCSATKGRVRVVGNTVQVVVPSGKHIKKQLVPEIATDIEPDRSSCDEAAIPKPCVTDVEHK
eukprot:GHVQ01019354.1.p2 GENE.GHVQ01019354.1~~GHVQ01019354.1.p2  ORF type:complete len:276 (+),score=32.55 GHVQ01019354.1:1212-2039(+)